MSIKIFHTADVHIGLKFSGRDYSPELKSKLQAEPLDCLQRMVDKANSGQCDLFVIAGDMFDKINIPKADIKKAAEILNTFNGTNVLVLPGNHDFYEDRSESLWNTFKEKINEQLVILLCRTEPYEIQVGEHRIIVYPGVCRTKHSSKNEISWVKDYPKEKDYIHIGIAHGSVEKLSPDADQNYFPMKVEDFKNSGVDFWLLGHTHIRYPETGGKGNPLFFMPSTPAPDGFDCQHEGYAWYIEAGSDKVLKYESIRTGKYKFKTIQQEIRSFNDIQKLNKEIIQFDLYTLLKLQLYGKLSRDEMSKLPEFFNGLYSLLAYVEFEVGNISLNIDREYIDKSYTINSLPHRLLLKLSSNTDNNLALQLAHQLLEEARK